MVYNTSDDMLQQNSYMKNFTSIAIKTCGFIGVTVLGSFASKGLLDIFVKGGSVEFCRNLFEMNLQTAGWMSLA
jgi:hypothetical protein